MELQPRTSLSVHEHAATTLAIGSFFLIWMLSSWMFLESGRTLTYSTWQAVLLWVIQVICHIFLASAGLGLWHRHGDRYFAACPRARSIYLGASVAVGVVCITIHTQGSRSWLIPMVHTANLIFFATLTGTFLVQAVRRIPEILVICIGLSMADLFSVLKGPTQQAVQSLFIYYQKGMLDETPWVDWLLIKLTLPGTDFFQPIFGVSDWIAIVLLSASAVKLGVRDNLFGIRHRGNTRYFPYLPVAAVGLLASIAAADLLAMFIPALPLICAGQCAYLLWTCPEARQFTASDRKLASCFILGFIGLFVLMDLIAC